MQVEIKSNLQWLLKCFRSAANSLPAVPSPSLPKLSSYTLEGAHYPDASSWSIDDVGSFFESIGFSDQADAFREQVSFMSWYLIISISFSAWKRIVIYTVNPITHELYMHLTSFYLHEFNKFHFAWISPFNFKVVQLHTRGSTLPRCLNFKRNSYVNQHFKISFEFSK